MVALSTPGDIADSILLGGAPVLPPPGGSSADPAHVPSEEPAIASPSVPPTPSMSHDWIPLPPSPDSSARGALLPRETLREGTAPPDLDLPPEVLDADISIAPDGSFVETSSGAAARELKRRYDQYLGVGKDVRSPYAITAFINQHGKPMFRVGRRELSAPAASAEDIENRTSSYSSGRPPRQSYPYTQQPRRRSRMSVHSFLPSAVFKNGPAAAHHAAHQPDGTRSPPVRKLRKTRSIPNQLSSGADKSSMPAAQGTPTSRPHAHSVSSADAFRASMPPPLAPATLPQRDVFADVMVWQGPPGGSSQPRQSVQASRPPSHDHAADSTVLHPFGPGVSFDSPSWRSRSHLTSPPVLREMQSFESGLTARADQQGRLTRGGAHDASTTPTAGNESSGARPSASSSLTPDTARAALTPRDETIMHSPYSTEVFDILQTSRGLPSLDRLTATTQETTIKLSLKADESAAPRDDPRFVIWGEVQPDEVEDESRASTTDLSSVSSGPSRKKSLRGRSSSAAPAEATPPPVSEGPMKMLIAASIERWIAQLTSELNYDELLIFFLTYRTYISALDLGHLLICRFHWALGEPSSSRDEMVRRIVRVRTFTAMRYWVVTFFDADFVPNRELRLLFADWLNSLRKDPILERHKDALKIVRQLRKVFLECKDGHLRRILKQPNRKVQQASNRVPVLDKVAGLGGPVGRFSENGVEDFDIDLDFDIGLDDNEHTLGLNTTSDGRPSGPVDLAMLRQPLQLAFIQYGKRSPPSMQSSGISNPILLPVPHGPLSRVLGKTIGRLGRWKRVLNSRTPGRTPLNACLDVSAFDIEANETGDLLLVRGGVEQYLKMMENQMSQTTLIGERVSRVIPSYVASSVDSENTATGDPRPSIQLSGALTDFKIPNGHAMNVHLTVNTDLSQPSSSRPVSNYPAYSDSVGSIGNLEEQTIQRQLDVVSIDDLDLSDLSSTESIELSAPSGLKKSTRRLPNRRDFEFVRQSTDSVSSMGIQSRGSMASASSASSVGLEVGGPIHQWQMTALVDSLSEEDEDGDVEAALRRLEGQISLEKQRAKESKVDKWVRSIQQRQVTGHVGTDSAGASDDEDYAEVDWQREEVAASRSASRASASRLSGGTFSDSDPVVPPGLEPLDSSLQAGQGGGASDSSTSNASTEAKPAVEDAVPLEILQSRVESAPPPPTNLPTASPPPRIIVPASPPSKVSHPPNMRRHYSFVLGCRAETLMQHFSMIDRELFLNIRFEELVAPHIMGTAQDTNILDWANFLRERARLKAEGRVGHQTGSLTVVRGRFNLIANFVISEIVLTHPTDRMRLFTKFIRLTWKAYEMKNFNMLVALVAGLKSDWVSRAMRQCHERLRASDQRVLDDLTSWTTRAGHFLYIRRTVEALTEAKPIEVNAPDASVLSSESQSTRSRAASETKPPSAPACVPFFGIYLSQLQPYADLSDLIDPTAPHEPVGIDPESNTFEALAHPEVFSTLAPLPPSMQLEPLINVHKQRLVATVVKSFVAAQHLASRVQYPLDKKLFQRCLKLRGLDTDTLQRALELYVR